MEINNLTKRKINEERLFEIFRAFSKKYNLKKENVSLAIVPGDKMREVNLIYRGKDESTDVLAFCDLAEILIDPDKINGKNFSNELYFIFVHGLLHLAGFRDDSEEQRLRMIKEGEDFLASLK